MAGQVLNALIGFGSISLLTRKLEVDYFGTWVLYLTVFGLLELLRTGLVYQALVKFLYQEESRKEVFILAARQLNFIIGLALSALFLLIGLGNYIWQVFEQATSYGFWWYAVLSLFIGPYYIKLWLCQAQEKYLKLWILQFFTSAVLLIYILSSSVISLELLIAVHSITRISASLVLFFKKVEGFSAFWHFKYDEIKTMLAFSRFTALSTMTSQLLKSSDIFLINHFWGASMVAIYQIPVKLLEIVEIPLRAWMISAYPRLVKSLAHSNFRSFKNYLNKEISSLTFITVLTSIMSFYFSNEIILYFAGDQFEPSILLFQVFLVYLIFLPADKYLGVAIDAMGQPQHNTLKVLIMLLVNIIGDFVVLSLGLHLAWVAAITILNIVSGITFGYYQIKKKVKLQKMYTLELQV